MKFPIKNFRRDTMLKKRLFTLFMLTGTLTQTLLTSTNVIADVNPSEKSSTELVADTNKDTTISYKNLSSDTLGETITSLSIVDNKLVATKTKNHNELGVKVGYYLYSSDSPVFEENTATKIDMLLLDNPQRDTTTLEACFDINTYPNAKYYYMVDTNYSVITPMVQIDGSELVGK